MCKCPIVFFLSLLFSQLLDFLTDTDTNTAENVLVFVREALQRYPDLKGSVVSRLIEEFSHIYSVEVHRSILWILGEYCTSVEDINRLMQEIRISLGEVSRELIKKNVKTPCQLLLRILIEHTNVIEPIFFLELHNVLSYSLTCTYAQH